MDKDIIYTDDLQILNGDFLVAESEVQHTEHVIRSEKGAFYQWPEIGFGISNLVNASLDIKQITKGINDALRLDNKKLKTLQIENNTIKIDASRL